VTKPTISNPALELSSKFIIYLRFPAKVIRQP
jgi:hypothetical protein